MWLARTVIALHPVHKESFCASYLRRTYTILKARRWWKILLRIFWTVEAMGPGCKCKCDYQDNGTIRIHLPLFASEWSSQGRCMDASVVATSILSLSPVFPPWVFLV